jgi:hypothetical protein
MENVEAVPRRFLARRSSQQDAGGERQDCETIGARVCTLPYDHHRTGSVLQNTGERMLAACDLLERIRPSA